MAQNVKKCPKKHGGCNRSIAKNGGCMHMTCRKEKGGCGFEFCWLCLGPWSTHGSSTGGYYACNNYEQAGKYLSEGAAREWSTVVDISIPPPCFIPVSYLFHTCFIPVSLALSRSLLL